MSVPIPCEVRGKIVFHNLANLEAKVRRGDRLPRYCSQSCMRRSVAMRREGRT